MIKILVVTMLLAAPAAAGSVTEGSDLLPHAVTIEGTASLEITADTCKAIYVVAVSDESPADALEGLSGARSTFETALRRVVGTKGSVAYKPPRIKRLEDSEPVTYQASQKAVVKLVELPGTAEEFSEYIVSITKALVATGVIDEKLAAPELTFQITNPKALESRFVSMAIEDARSRAGMISRPLNRGLGRVHSARFPAGVTMDGRMHRFSGRPTPVVGTEFKMTLTYTIQIVFDLEV